MKTLLRIFLVLLTLILMNYLTFLIFGKQTLRDRNLTELKKQKVGTYRNMPPTYSLLSNQNFRKKRFQFRGSEYPVFQISDINDDEYPDFRTFIDSVINHQSFDLEVSIVSNIVGTNLDSLDSNNEYKKVDSILDKYYKDIILYASDSLSNLPVDKQFDGYCSLYKYISCYTNEGWITILGEEVYYHSLFFADQKLLYGYLGESYEEYREEKMVWLYYKWIQFEWVDGNGLAGDKTEPIHSGDPEPFLRDWEL